VNVKVVGAFLLVIVAAAPWSFAQVSDRKKAAGSVLGSLLPRESLGWRAEAEDHLYNPETIFDYIDGAGEVYRAYNFRELLSRRFKKDGKPDIVIDLFDMGAAADAFGVFTHDLDGDDVQLGQGANYKGGLLSFWKDRYFVSVYAEGETAETKDALFAMGRAVDSAIPGRVAKPELVGLIPPPFDDRRAVHYFHSYVILNYHFFVSRENIFGLDRTAEAALSRSGEKNDRIALLLVRYPVEERAAEAFQNFSNVYMRDFQGHGFVQTENRKWTAAARRGDLLAIVFDAPSVERAKEILAGVGTGRR